MTWGWCPTMLKHWVKTLVMNQFTQVDQRSSILQLQRTTFSTISLTASKRSKLVGRAMESQNCFQHLPSNISEMGDLGRVPKNWEWYFPSSPKMISVAEAMHLLTASTGTRKTWCFQGAFFLHDGQLQKFEPCGRRWGWNHSGFAQAILGKRLASKTSSWCK